MTEQTTHFAGDLDTDVSLEVWELTLPEDEAKCQGVLCLRAARWRCVPICGHDLLSCDPHHEQQVGFGDGEVHCTKCLLHQQNAALIWHRI